ncbi:Low molecular weight protein tyrosine phosphatase (EC [uncultured Gammaproteobacteria bacterium]|nr:Low molecular weight protein tyrosine phosphatase (EC [uncultured Gammaproteobacteria bacterium]
MGKNWILLIIPIYAKVSNKYFIPLKLTNTAIFLFIDSA